MDLINSLKEIIYDLTHWEQKYPGGEGIYHLFEIDLSEARENKIFPFDGDQLIVTDCEAQAYLKLNNKRNSLIDLNVVRNINSRFKEFYITNSASAGKNLMILAGANGIFNCNSPQIVDIARQNIDRVIIRDHDGGIESSETIGVSVPAGDTVTIKTITGKGSFRWAYFVVTTGVDSQKVIPSLIIDNIAIEPVWNYEDMDVNGMNANTRPWQLTRYGVNSTCMAILYPMKGIIFDTNCIFKATNPTGTNHTITLIHFAQKLP